jgi:uncharacterized BrkB/YihY/UPF0761 family membrane protein
MSTRTVGSCVQAAVSVIVIVLYSSLSFTRALQRVYLKVWRLQAQPLEAPARQLAWMLGLIAYLVVLSTPTSTDTNWAARTR